MFKRLIASLLCLTFSLSNLQYVHAQDFSVNQLPVPGTMVGKSVPFAPLALKGLIVNPQKPLEFQFIVDTGKGPQDTPSIKEEANQLVKYFLAGLTIPEGDLWVNLSPYEKNRMVPAALGQTDLGRDLLAQDYILKQLTASLIYPEKDLGKEFWSRVYAKAQAQFGTTNVPINTFNKVWILPDQAQVFEHGAAVYVTKTTLKVMLDEDYLAKQKHQQTQASSISSQIVRAIVIPEITKEVNTGKNFAPLRQIYQALILAKWYKETIQNSLLDAVYTNKNKVAGVKLNDPAVKDQIYERYLKAYKKGTFNYIKEDPTPDGQVVPRKYFSGGLIWAMKIDPTGKQSNVKWDGAMVAIIEDLERPGLPKDAAMTSTVEERVYKVINDYYFLYTERKKSPKEIANLRFDKMGIITLSELGDKLGEEFNFNISASKEYWLCKTTEDVVRLIEKMIGESKKNVEKMRQMIHNVLSEIDSQLAKDFSEQRFASTKEIMNWVYKLERIENINKDARLSNLSHFFERRIKPVISPFSANLEDVKLIPNKEGFTAEFGHFMFSVEYDDTSKQTKCTLKWDEIEGYTWKKLKFTKIGPDADAKLSELIREGVLIDYSSTEVRLKSKLDQKTVDRIREIAGSYAGKFLRILQVFQDTWFLAGDWSKSRLYDEIIFLGNHDYIWRSISEWMPSVYGSMKEMYLDALRIPLLEGTFEIVTKSRGKIKLKLIAISENEIRGLDERSQEIPPITSEDFVQAQEMDEAMLGAGGHRQIFSIAQDAVRETEMRIKHITDRVVVYTEGMNILIIKNLSNGVYYYIPFKNEHTHNPENYFLHYYIEDDIGIHTGPVSMPTMDEEELKKALKAGGEVLEDIFRRYGPEQIDENEEKKDIRYSILEKVKNRGVSKTIRETKTGWGFNNLSHTPLIVEFKTDNAQLSSEKQADGAITVEKIEILDLSDPRLAISSVKSADKAALVTENGGIDLNRINVKRTGKTINVQFDPAQLSALEQGGFQGFVPVIINITRITSPFQLLGIKEPKQPELLAKV